ncbi:beta-lactamase domain-containing protein 2-like [Acanthaster planci]|uniref:Beta-lactamase domain-containing protein 2-like n=1 Tax=Acanthaster planci TaxID=133434 RepID=A0A8B7ZH72_ACAPL|nr:beta-lactamase domain-containing protein 2-like [Acanthaster planci]
MITRMQRATSPFWAPVMSLFDNAVIGWLTSHFCVWWRRKQPPTQGFVAPGFEPVAELFRKNFETGVEHSTGGSAFSVYHEGSKVVDLWGGFADTDVRQVWKEDTMTVIFSATKGIAALCIAMLVDRGLLDYDQKVSFYWPEFAQHGKKNITVRMLLNHEAGLAATSQPISLRQLKDQDALGRLLAESPPRWSPGVGHGYHAFTFGLYCSQLLMRVDPQHRTLGQFFKEEVADPFDIDIHIGLPLELNYRVARLTGIIDSPLRLSYIPRDVGSWHIVWAFLTGRSFIHEVIHKSTDLIKFSKLIQPEARALENPSCSGIGTARAAAKVYGILANGGQTPDGQRLLSDELVEGILTKAGPPSVDKVVGVETNFSSGFLLLKCEGSQQFGHPGAGGQQCVADPHYKLGMGYVSSHFSPYGLGNDPRFLSLQKATYQCIRNLEAKGP